MNRALISWFRVVLPPATALGSFLFSYGVVEAVYLAVALEFGPANALGVLKLRDYFLLAACASYAAFRGSAFHPLDRASYRKWLELTPWTSDKPLPLGPVHLVPQDACVLAVLLALAHEPQISLWWLPLVLLFVNLAHLCGTFFALGQFWTGYTVALGLGLVARLSGDPATATAAATAVYLLAFLGLRQSLASFPWAGATNWQEKQQAMVARLQSKLALSWPTDWLAPRAGSWRISVRDGSALSLLAGWWSYALLSLVRDPILRQGFAVLFSSTCLLAPLIRLSIYCANYRSPLGFWGRLWTLRWIIPGDDQVFVAPLVSAAAGVATGISLFLLGQEAEISQSAALTVTLLLTFNLGPTFERWRLTGNHRIVPGTMNKQEMVKL